MTALADTVPTLPDVTHTQDIPSPSSTPKPTRPSEAVYHPWAIQLSLLASQHHMSEYSRIKYGYLGSPIQYAPMSLHVPNVVRELRERQVRHTDQVLWWPCPSPSGEREILSDIPATEQRTAWSSEESCSAHSHIQQELCDALSDSIPRPCRVTSPSFSTTRSPTVKTSETHPMHISAIIPPESLPAISSNLTQCTKPSPVLFDIPPQYSLDRIVGYKHYFPSLASAPMIPIRPSCSVDAQLSCVPIRPPQTLHRRRPSISDALRTAISTKLSIPPLRLPLPRPQPLKQPTTNCIKIPREKKVDVVQVLPKFLTPRRSVFAPPQSRSLSEPSDIFSPSVIDITLSGNPLSPPHKSPLIHSTFRESITRENVENASPWLPMKNKSRLLKLGNLLLSSCPGKKVRLDGPVRGKSAVCRNLELDLKRVRDVGARCIVCCLDDDELRFLGVSWEEYCQRAHQEGLDVLRVPLPEGLCPLSPQLLDADLTRIIESYTLQGIPVLVHCRGGVGRAGLVACCWVLKLGLCGWIETDVLGNIPAESKTVGPFTNDWGSDITVRRDTLQLVERVIGVLRVRRSVKAIETLEQVKFLVEFVDYLRVRGHGGMSREDIA